MASRLLVGLAALWAGCGIFAKASPEILEALGKTFDEEVAKKILEPHLTDLKTLDPVIMERVVLSQWWDIARDMVARSHTQQVDLSFSVRKAVRTLKDEADELLRTLNPKYGEAQLVSPAFQWAQNDTCIFITVKFTVRWNAPGAVEVTEPTVVMGANSFNFTGYGKHSNNKYKYALGLDLFDNILDTQSVWNVASVGKLSITLKKRWPRKWPRLLNNKKQKISNMHVWMDQQEKLDSSLGGMTTVSNSPITCGAADKLYCLGTDTCKKAENCSQCPGKSIPELEQKLCTGMPTEKASLSFKDGDMDLTEIGGDVKITKAKNEFDIDRYVVYYGKDDKTKLEDADGKHLVVGEAKPTGGEAFVHLAQNTAIPEGATNLLVFSSNEHGEYGTAGSVWIKDAVLPKGRPSGLLFEDEDGEAFEVSGTITIQRAEDESHIDEYAVHWGRTDKKKVASGSYVRDISRGTDPEKAPTHYVARNTKLPDGAQFLLVYAKNSHGENPSPFAVRVVDHTKPCLKDTAKDCPKGVSATTDADPLGAKVATTVELQRAESEDTITHYEFYWGRKGCDDGGQNGAKNGFLKSVPVADVSGPIVSSFNLETGTVFPASTTHILAFAKGKYGESDHCVSAVFEDDRSQEPEAEKKQEL